MPAPKAPATKIAEMLASAEARVKRLTVASDKASAHAAVLAAQLREAKTLVMTFQATAQSLTNQATAKDGAYVKQEATTQ